MEATDQLNEALLSDDEVITTETGETEYKFDWKLDPEMFKNTIFDKKKMREYADIKMIYGFVKSNMGINYSGIKRYEGLPYKTELDQMIKFKETYNGKKKWFDVGHHLPKHKWGRVIPSGYTSLAVLHRPTRHSLASGRYVDIDMKNAQPTILLEICNHHNLAKPALKKYVENPTHYRQRIMEHHNCNKDIAKQLPITLMFGGTYDGWIRENNIQGNSTTKLRTFYDLENEVKDLIEIIYNANKDTLTRDVKRQSKDKWRNVNEEKRGTMGLWGQSVERLLQETAIKWLVDNKDFAIEDIIPSQDGFMILEELFYEGIIDDIETAIIEKWNIELTFVVKPFDEAIDIPIDDITKTADEWEDELSEKRIAERFLQKYGHYTARNGDQVFIYYETKNALGETIVGRWYDETNEKKRFKLTLYISEDIYDFYYGDLNGEVGLDEKDLKRLLKLLRIKTSNKIQKIVEHILPKIEEKERFNDKPYLLGFENGVVELYTGEFRPYKYDDYMTMTTGYDYIPPPTEEDENYADWNTRYTELCDIIETIQPDLEQRDLFLQVLASGLDGKLYQKLILNNGAGGNGKSLITSLMKCILGDYYYQAPNGLIKDIEKANNASPDLYGCMNKRYINFTEVDGKVRVAMLRNITGGGTFRGRMLYGNPVDFNMSATITMDFNNAPDLDGKPMASDYRRLMHINYIRNFTDDENKIGKTIDGIMYLKANPYYETEEFRMNMRQVFLNLLIEVYKRNANADGSGIAFKIPQSVRARTEKFIEDQNLFQKVFNDCYAKVSIKVLENGEIDKADQTKKTLRIKDFWDCVAYSQDYKDLKTTRAKREYGRDECYKWLRSNFNVKPDKKNGEYIVGIIRREDVEEEGEDDVDDETTNEDAETETETEIM